MFETCQNLTMEKKKKKGFLQVALASLLITWNMFTIGQDVSTSDNDQVKGAGKDYVMVKPLRPVCVCIATLFTGPKNKKYKNIKFVLTNFHRILLILNIYIYIYILYKYIKYDNKIHIPI